jgi:hypothetical protein
MVGERLDDAEVSAIEGQDGIGLKLGGKGDVDGVRKIQPQVEVAGPYGLGGVEDVGSDRGEYGATRSGPAPDVIDRLVGRRSTEDAPTHMLDRYGGGTSFRLVELAPGVTEGEVRAATGAPITTA